MRTKTKNVQRVYTKLAKMQVFLLLKFPMKTFIFFFIIFIISQVTARNINEALFFALFLSFFLVFVSYRWAIEAKKEEEKRKKYMYNFDL